jgi:hypothetical protein
MDNKQVLKEEKQMDEYLKEEFQLELTSLVFQERVILTNLLKENNNNNRLTAENGKYTREDEIYFIRKLEKIMNDIHMTKLKLKELRS